MIRQAKEQDFKELFPILEQIFDEMELATIAAIDDKDFYHLLEEGWHTKGYRYSLGRTLVAEEDGAVVGMLTSYSAEDEDSIDSPLEQYYAEVGLPASTKIFTDREAQPNEWYIDSLAVAPAFQGHGIGGSLLDAAPELARKNGYKKISLNVDQTNPGAKHLYVKKGFETLNEMTIGDHLYDHMIKNV